MPTATPVANFACEESPNVVVTDRDIIFDCTHCGGELVVDVEGTGMTLACTHCDKNVTVPTRAEAILRAAKPMLSRSHAGHAVPPAPVAVFENQSPEQITQRIEDLRRQLGENISQTTEMRGHVNRATIELHRMQLKLKKLMERQAGIECELQTAKRALDGLN